MSNCELSVEQKLFIEGMRQPFAVCRFQGCGSGSSLKSAIPIADQLHERDLRHQVFLHACWFPVTETMLFRCMQKRSPVIRTPLVQFTRNLINDRFDHLRLEYPLVDICQHKTVF
jgi:hypothetical protein